ncbi:MAG: glycosyltransferase [Gemmatimonadaceae bacterium]|nr:glycosyltransferase [Chitinophagaceae bacterium]
MLWPLQPGTRILFANFPAEGHFNPLTGLAVHLKEAGYDVRWYTSNSFASRIMKMQIKHYPFKAAKDVNGMDELLVSRKRKKTLIGKMKYDLIHGFILRAPEYFEDISDIYKTFPFDILIADCAFTAIPFVADKLRVPVISIGVLPLIASSRDLAPVGLGMTPSYTRGGKLKQQLLRWLCSQIILKGPNRIMRKLLDQYYISHENDNVFDLIVSKSTLLLQSGTPGFEYDRSDMPENVRFIGPLLPVDKKKSELWFNEKLLHYSRMVFVTQGTVETDVEKLIVPALEAFRNSGVLVIVVTGGSSTASLRKRFPQDNFVIEDFIPYADVMPYADAYISNGGYGGVMLGVHHRLPMVVAGTYEGKNEINARVGFFKIGINLGTERPSSTSIRNAVEKLIIDPSFRNNLERLKAEFGEYNPGELCEGHVMDLLANEYYDRARATRQLNYN